jgi:hypothetical protein
MDDQQHDEEQTQRDELRHSVIEACSIYAGEDAVYNSEVCVSK